jgi:hypothetical protein
MRALIFAAIIAVATTGRLSAGQSEDILPECKTTPLGKMTREQIEFCQALEHFQGALKREWELTEPAPPDAMRVMRGRRETIELPPGR